MLAIPQSKVSPIHSVVHGESLHPDSKEHLKLQKENKSQSLEQQPHPINRASSIYGSPSMTVAGMELKYKYKILHKRKYTQYIYIKRQLKECYYSTLDCIFSGAKERRSRREKEIKLKPESLAKAEVDEGDWLTSFFHHLDSS